MTGEQFAETFLRPLSPATVLPLALGSVPIDIVLGMVLQSVNDADNAEVLSGSDGAASPRFRRLLHDLRTPQEAGLLDVQLGHPSGAGKGGRPKGTTTTAEDETSMTVRDSDDPTLETTVFETRRLLGLSRGKATFDIVYGRRPPGPSQVAMLTRSLLTTLASVAFAIDVPRNDVSSGRTMPTIAKASPIMIHAGRTVPGDAFVAARYDREWYWGSIGRLSEQARLRRAAEPARACRNQARSRRGGADGLGEFVGYRQEQSFLPVQSRDDLFHGLRDRARSGFLGSRLKDGVELFVVDLERAHNAVRNRRQGALGPLKAVHECEHFGFRRRIFGHGSAPSPIVFGGNPTRRTQPRPTESRTIRVQWSVRDLPYPFARRIHDETLRTSRATPPDR